MTQNNPKPESLFQQVRAIMSLPPDFDPEPAAPWTDTEFELYAGQEPLPPNQSASLPAEEQIELTI